MKKIWTFFERFKRKLKLSESPEWKLAGNLRKKWGKKSKEFKRNKIKLINLKIEKRKIWNSEKLERNLKKSWDVFDELVQNNSKQILKQYLRTIKF